MTPLERFVRRLSKVEDEVKHLKKPSLAHSSIENGAVAAYDINGTATMQIGLQHDGSSVAATLSGPVPPTPSAPIVTGVPGGVTVEWDGYFASPLVVAPMDFKQVDVVVSPSSTADFIATVPTTSFLSPRGGKVFVPTTAHAYVALVTRTAAGTPSTPSVMRDAVPQAVVTQVTQPPATSPTLIVTGTPRGMIVQATDIPSGSLIDYHISTIDSFTPNAATLWRTTASTVVNIESLPGGAALDSTATYYLRTVAHNAVGNAAPSAQATGGIRLNDDSSIASLAVSKLIAGDLVGAFALFGSLQVGNITITPGGGIVIPQPNGGTITLPADGTAATVTADLVAYSLKVIDNLIISGTINEVASGSTLNLANGVSKPSAAPNVGATYPSVKSAIAGSGFEGNLTGLVIDGTNYVMASPFFQGGGIEFINTTTGARGFPVDLGGNFAPYGGLTKVGTEWFVLGRDFSGSRNGDWWIRKYSSSWVKTGESRFTIATTYTPAIGSDGSNLFLGRSYAGKLYIYIFPTSAVGSSIDWSGNVYTTGYDLSEDVRSIIAGSYDLGAKTYILTTPTTHMALDFASIARQSSREWPVATGSNARGLAWDGTRFHMLDDTGYVRKYSRNVQTTHSVAYTWFDSDVAGSGQHETQESPRKTYILPKRGWLTVATAPPNDTGDADAPDSVRVYVGFASNGSLNRQTDLGPGVISATYDLPVTSNTPPPTTNGFTSANLAAAVLQTASGATYIKGDDSVAIPGKLQGGVVSNVAVVSGMTNVTVTFPRAFAAGVTPAVTVSLSIGTGTSGRNIYYGSVTNTGFQARIMFDGAATVSFSWTAVKPD